MWPSDWILRNRLTNNSKHKITKKPKEERQEEEKENDGIAAVKGLRWNWLARVAWWF